MMEALHREHELSEAHLLARNVRYEEDLVDQLFNSSEKRLAQILLLLAHWNGQAGNGTAFAVTHNNGANSTAVRLGAFSVALNQVPLMTGQSRNATGNINPPSGH